jgi:hypothetical protein
MKPPIFVRSLSKHEREALESGLRSSALPSSCVVARSFWPAPPDNVRLG